VGAEVDRDLVAALFDRHKEPLYRFLRRLLRDDSAAEDLTQEVFVRAMRVQGQHITQERAWVFQIARNLARDFMRREAYRGPTLDYVDEPGPYNDRADALAVHAAVRDLPEEDREIFLLREVSGLSYAEIAHACDVTTDVVRNRLHRTRLALRQTLAARSVGPGQRIRP
jgi:RNA polymerase sigma-70 factor (ECF subfamily)